MSQKRGQLTLFIVLGIVLVISFSVFFYIINYSKESTIGLEVEETFDRDIKDVKFFVETCLDSNIRTGLDMLGKQGGYIEFPENFPFQETSGTYIPLHYNEGTVSLPTVEDMEDFLTDYIGHNLGLCINDFVLFEDRFDFSNTEIDVNISISESGNTVIIEFNQNVIIKGRDTIFKLSDLNKDVPVKLRKIHEFAEKVIEAYEEYDDPDYTGPSPDFVTNVQDYIDFLSQNDLSLNHLPTEENFHLFLWQVVGLAGNEKFNFIFGTKSEKNN
jgi:hypothetical protein